MKKFGNMMKQAQQMQAKLMKLQEEGTRMIAEASAGGGMVTAIANGHGDLVSVRIEKDVVDPDDVNMLEDLVTAAVNEAIRKAREVMAEEMKKLTGGINIPGMM